MHARHYSPTLGRFLQPDPDGSEANLYAYTANNPVTELDPDGTCFILCAIVNAVVDTAIYLATTDQSEWSLGGVATAAATGAVTGFLGVGLLSKVTKIGTVAKVLSKVSKAGRGLTSSASRVVTRMRSGGNSVYWAGSPTSPTYVGITNNLARRGAQHLAKAGRTIHGYDGLDDLSRFAAHSVEQALINRHGLMRNGGRLMNKIHSVSRSDPLYKLYVWNGNRLLRKTGH
jgi:uncharacterized protein RhaS with RHS repeats